MTSKIQDQSFHLAWNSGGTVTLSRTEAWALLLAAHGTASVQLQQHQAHWKDTTPGQCKQRTSWHVKKHSCPISQTYRTWWSNTLFKPVKDTSLGVRSKGLRRQIILMAVEEREEMYSHRLQVQCLGLRWCRKQTQGSDQSTWPQRSRVPPQCSSWVPALAAAPQVTGRCHMQEFGSACTSAQRCGPGRAVLPRTSGWS